MGQEMPAVSRCWKGKETDALLQPQKGCSPVNDFGPMNLWWVFELHNIGKFLLFEATWFIVICYSRNRKQIPQRKTQSRREIENLLLVFTITSDS